LIIFYTIYKYRMTSIVNAKEDKVIRSIFIYYDTDGDNYLVFDEFKKLCSNLGFDLQDFQFDYINGDGDNKISYDEFKEWWLKDDKLNVLSDENADNMYYAYDIYKKSIEEYGVLNYKNFNEMIKKYYDCTITKSEFDKYNKNKNDGLEFSEFSDWLNWI
jgi:Ca2+-binding EF-hand superfamily protein